MKTAGVSCASVFFLMTCAHPAASVQCDFAEFMSAPYDHIIEQEPTATLSEFRGRIKTKAWQVGSEWVPGVDVQIEVHGPGGFSEVLKVANDGQFARQRLPAGTYCYKVSADGFRSIMGAAILRPGASSQALVLELKIAE